MVRSTVVADAGVGSAAPAKWRTAIRLLTSRQRMWFAFLIVARIVVGFFDLALAAAMYLLFVLLQGRSPAQHFWWLPTTILSSALATSILVGLRVLIDFVSARSVFRAIQNLATDFLLRLTQGYGEVQWIRFVERNRSELASHAAHTARDAADFYHRSIELISGAVIVATMMAAFIYQSAIAAFGFACALAGFYLLHQLIIRVRVQKAAANREAALIKLQKNLADLFLSWKEIRTYGNQAFFYGRIRREAEVFGTANRRTVFLPQIARTIADQGTVLLFLGLIVAVELRQGDTRQLISLLAFYFVLSRRLLPLVSQISLIAGQMESSYENVRIVDSELAECRRHRAPALPTQLPVPGFVIMLDQVSFRFNNEKLVLRNIDLLVRNGEIVVLYGASGIGKSSLLNLIAGVTEPSVGVVRVDRQAMAYVPQEIALLDDSIRNNLLFGLAAKTDVELWSALAAARLDTFVAAQQQGLETAAGDNGALFSGGERQRLGMARAILRADSLLLLDEATSALDAENERDILANLAAAGTAVFLVTHRAQARQFAHRVFRLVDGFLVEEQKRTRFVVNEPAQVVAGQV